MRQFGRELAASADRPDGIVCDSELRSISLISGLEEGGVTIGRELNFICKQTSDILPTVFPDVDTVEEDVFAAGVELTRLLLRRIEGETPENLQTLSEPIVHWRS
jgi:LacI family transcriptional regulator